MAFLEFQQVGMHFGGLKAVDQLSFAIEKGELAGLIGPNGAGKTTVFNVLTGVYQPTFGEIYFNAKKISGLKSFSISRLGIARTFQNIRLFHNLTVLENVLIACHQHSKYGFFESIFKTPSYFREEAEMRDQAIALLKIFSLHEKANKEARSLPYGEQRKLEIVRALATRPQLILLDEPAAGMNHSETSELMQTISKIRKDFNLTILLIEHDMKLVMGICEKIFVLDHGLLIAQGNAKDIQNNPKVVEAYLGAPQGAET